MALPLRLAFALAFYGVPFCLVILSVSEKSIDKVWILRLRLRMTRLKQTPCGLLVILSEAKYPQIKAWISALKMTFGRLLLGSLCRKPLVKSRN